MFSDLRPYVCLSVTCTRIDETFQRRNEWIRHMLNEHWRLWTCPLGCSLEVSNSENLLSHVEGKHGDLVSAEKIEVLISLSSRTDETKVEEACSLCQKCEIKTMDRYKTHVGHHLEQLALFSVPRTYRDENSETEGEEGTELSKMCHSDDGNDSQGNEMMQNDQLEQHWSFVSQAQSYSQDVSGPQESPPFHCHTCGKTYAKLHQLRLVLNSPQIKHFLV